MNAFESPDPRWRKSRYSNGQGSCVEVGHAAGRAIAVRDTKDSDGPHLAFGHQAWEVFTTQIKNHVNES